ncbi:hypothetical protein [Curtobacterium sp. RRHDQ10]|uniref:hypothetical protein n=1 Tax=Curtobacterium phyllosphaerae TaxID=3413379 RepID=UPI003BF426BF
MANATTSTSTNGDAIVPSFRAIQLLPAPMTILALVIAAGHGLEATPLAVIAAIGALATIASTLLPTVQPRSGR